MHHALYMQRCLDLAQQGSGAVSPNPMVGCVIVHDEKIIGEGYHQQFGTAHAEVNAVNAVIEKYPDAPELLKGSTVYVNLEPCAHFGKTPPCADLLVKYGVKAVVIGNADPNPAVNGKGIAKLEDGGIQVTTGVLEKECAFLNRRFFTRITKQRPYVILKWAQTADGYFAPDDGTQQWITGEESKALVHKWRAEEDAVLVGKRTAMADDPALTVRAVKGRNPVRILIDANLEVDQQTKLYNSEAPTIVLNALKTEKTNNIHFIQLEDMHFYLTEKIMYQLYLMDIQSVIIEGGANILNQFIQAGLWDEARIFTSANPWGNGLKAPLITNISGQVEQVGNDTLTTIFNT